VALAPAWPKYTSQGDLLQFVAPTANQVTHAQIDSEHNCSMWDEISPAP
jgi:hypothetical protein